MNKEIEIALSSLREKKPLVHHITNYVTVNDCANITLAIGASPVMADSVDEVCDMVSISSSLVLNIGTINDTKLKAMILAAKKANELNIPIVLDPVGVGATPFRKKAVDDILNAAKISVIRGNLSEIKNIYGMEFKGKGVDAEENMGSIEEAKAVAKNLSKNLNTTIAITGATDIISDGKDIYSLSNGKSLMAKVTGTGCMCTSLIGCFLGATNAPLVSAVSAIAAMDIAGEIAYENLNKAIEGTSSYKMKIIDAISNLEIDHIKNRIKIS